jgi:hypothetical protein
MIANMANIKMIPLTTTPNSILDSFLPALVIAWPIVFATNNIVATTKQPWEIDKLCGNSHRNESTRDDSSQNIPSEQSIPAKHSSPYIQHWMLGLCGA